MSDFTEHREEVIDYIKANMVDQGASRAEAITATTCILFWDSKDVENLYKCIHSELDDHVIAAIVAHDYNGLSGGYKDPYFLPKSTQFAKEEVQDALSC